jgi:hypothetical protein
VAALADVRDWPWLGPAELGADDRWRVRRDDGARHRPDLGLVIRGQRVAVEVELHAKAPARLKAILRGYRELIERGAIGGVSYVVDRHDVGALVEREAQSVRLAKALAVGSLETVMASARRGRSAGSEPA